MRRTSTIAALPWLLLLLACGVVAWLATRPTARTAGPGLIEASVLPPAGQRLDLHKGLALSPDGSRVVFAARGEDGPSRLWLRPLARASATPLPDTDGAESPFWSPDGRFLGYFQERKLFTLELATGSREAIAEASYPFGASWSADGTIVFTPDWGVPLMRITASGGTPEPVALPVGLDEVLAWPWFLPDGKHFLYLARNYASDAPMSELRVGSVTGGDSKLVVASNSNAQLVPPGLLVWWHGGNLRAQRFDLDRLELVDRPSVVASGVRFQADDGWAVFSISQRGVLAAAPGEATAQNRLTIVDRKGGVERQVGSPGLYYEPRLSPDGKKLAVDSSDEADRGDIWVIDVERGTGTRLTSFLEDDTEPVWSPTGDAVAFCSNHLVSEPAVFVKRLRSSDVAEPLVRQEGTNLRPRAWSRTGHLLVYRKSDGKGELWSYSMTDGSLRPYIAAPSTAASGGFSPDGRFVTYVSSDTGRPEVYVAGFPDPASRWRVSVDGGTMPMWSPRGDEIFFQSLQSELMAVAVSELGAGTGAAGGADLAFGVPERLFDVQIRRSTYNRQYDTVDGQRFLLNATVPPDSTVPLTVLVNWERGLERR